MKNKLKIALAQLNPLVGDAFKNVNKLIKIRSSLDDDVDLIVAPELYISGYPIDDLVLRAMPEKSLVQQWDSDMMHEYSLRLFGLDLPIAEWFSEEGIANQEIKERMIELSDKKMAAKNANVGPEIMRKVEKSLVLQMIDSGWRDHLQQLDFLRASIQLRAYGQKQPLLEYQKESFSMFEEMLGSLRERVTEILSRVEVRTDSEANNMNSLRPRSSQMDYKSAEERQDRIENIRRQRSMPRILPEQRDPANPDSWGKVPRNELCPCGSGKKYKRCHGMPK